MKKKKVFWKNPLKFKFSLRTLMTYALLSIVGVGVTVAQSSGTGIAVTPALSVQQQEKLTVSGNVIDQNGDPLIGVSVIAKGQPGVGTSTDENGRFSIKVNPKTVLEFSYIGYVTSAYTVENSTQSLTISMKEDINLMEEVVVVGYGVQKKVNVIGSVSQINSEKLENRTVPMLSNALAGQMTGVTVIQRSGRPGDSPGEIRVRGVGSIQADASALVLVDGVPGSINDVKPEDVQSISVLKDAATAAIYGARSANGVILVTTKTGSEGKTRVSYNGYVGFTQPTAFPDMVDSWEFATLYNEAIGSQTYSPDQIQKYKDGSDPDNFANSNFMKDVFSRNGIQTGHDLSVGGGGKTTQYYLTLGYLNQQGIVEKNEYSRFDARLNLTTDISSKLKLSTWIAGYSSKREEPGNMLSQIIVNSVRYPSIYAGKLSNGDYGLGPEQGGTPVAWLDRQSFFEVPEFKLTSRLRLDYTPIKDLKLSLVGGYNYIGSTGKNFTATMKLNDSKILSPSSLNEENKNFIFSTLQALADYNKQIGKHDISALLGYSFESESYRNLVAYRDNFPTNDLPYINVGSRDNMQNAGGGYDWAIQSLFGRFKYAYDQKYLGEVTVRYDGSSRFPETKKYATFPSIALGWRISEEAFFKDNVSFIHNLKLKASMGKLGNQNIGLYPYQNTYTTIPYIIGGSIAQGGYITSLKDPNISWESTRTTDGGIEVGFFKNGLLDFSVNYFYRKTTDLLTKPMGNVSTVLGLNVDYTNSGSLENKGWEFELSHRNKVGQLSYNIGGLFSIIQNKVLDLGVGGVLQKNGLIGSDGNFVGYPLQMYYGYKTDGMFLDQADIDAWANQSAVFGAKVKPGDLRYVDITGENGEKDGKVDPNYDMVYLGSRIPKYTFSMNMGAEYKGLDFSAQLYGVASVKGRLESYAGHAFMALGNIQRWQADGRWNPANPQRYNDYPRLEVIQNTGSMNTQLADFWVRDASYVRLKNIQLGYTLPKQLLEKIKVASIRIYANAENPFCWNKYPKGWDPEINTNGEYYPILATYTFGLNLRF